jgi:hypothetical protein
MRLLNIDCFIGIQNLFAFLYHWKGKNAVAGISSKFKSKITVKVIINNLRLLAGAYCIYFLALITLYVS